MRFIFIRHAESANNVLAKISYDELINNRTEDPNLTENAKDETKHLAKFLKTNFNINKFYTSALIRSLTTTQIIADEYTNTTDNDNGNMPQVEVFTDLHEFGGCHHKGLGKTGMNKDSIKELFKNFIIPDDADLTEGWWKSEAKETEEELKERVKRVIFKLKEIAGNIDNDDYTAAFISHGTFMNALFTVLLNGELLVDSIKYFIYVLDYAFGFNNLSISSFTINKKRDVKIEFLNFLINKENYN